MQRMFFLPYCSASLLTADAKVVRKIRCDVTWDCSAIISSGCEREALGVFNMGASSKLGELIFFIYLFVIHSYKHSS